MSPRRSILSTRKFELSLSGNQQSLIPDDTIQLNLRAQQAEVIQKAKRFTVLLAHRRFGKTVSAIATAIVKSRQIPYTRPQCHYYAPTYKQAKRVAWDYCKELCTPLGAKFSESDLKVLLPWGASLQLGSAEDPDASRGIYSDFAVLDEPGQMPVRMWTEVLRPALSDRRGGALFIGTPAGRHGLFYDQYEYARTSKDPEWIALCYRADETGILAADELESARRTLSDAEFDQEYLCSWDAAIKGAYWAATIQKIEAAGQISDEYMHRPIDPVHVVLDLGINDATACWFVQLNGDQVKLIDYAEYRNRSLAEIVADWRLRPYTYGKVCAPHDANVRDLSSGITRAEMLRGLGVDVVVLGALPVSQGIEAARLLLPRCFFNATKCREGLEALRQYRSDWEEQKGVLSLRPVHDWTSHGADAFRYLAVEGLGYLAGWGGELDYSRMDKRRCV